VAELVDALVSNTNEVTLVPVRLRPWVQQKKSSFFNKLELFFIDLNISSQQNPLNPDNSYIVPNNCFLTKKSDHGISNQKK
jgi:hypothetical protein